MIRLGWNFSSVFMAPSDHAAFRSFHIHFDEVEGNLLARYEIVERDARNVEGPGAVFGQKRAGNERWLVGRELKIQNAGAIGDGFATHEHVFNFVQPKVLFEQPEFAGNGSKAITCPFAPTRFESSKV